MRVTVAFLIVPCPVESPFYSTMARAVSVTVGFSFLSQELMWSRLSLNRVTSECQVDT